ncbi:phytanoyl-CoA dioxygenase family protein [Pseudanabaena sp. FACHB-2040]|uniref:phytanoyl-CoA dioxygenase family protein n=1 Tax=Pseudanabaena sp. FACHB-2040 TaxID=2692859 RepID=UPI0016891FAC|nr:phytanoyl-CoA dioxygenase family protein [Pseudanabaena sp. FACHB-2040]MBD2258715.1 phytanoyl-CoA dioxygenase family protein [Pseudanabaena sp. FACHB-2040]
MGRQLKITAEQIAQFQQDGYLVIDHLVRPDLVERLRDRIEPLFYGQFETGIYPDEWYWRPGLSLPDVTREICNGWKCDRTLASVALSSTIGYITATLSGWPGARIGQDSVWWKPPGGKAVALHQDGTYINYIEPPEMATCWIALEDVTADIGTIEYAVGSHTWPLFTHEIGEFHAPERDYQAAMKSAAAAAGVAQPKVVKIEMPAGSCVVHHGNTWHGSGPNLTSDRPRRSLGVHTLSSAASFRPDVPAGYIYGRYKRVGDTTMDESFFPILWTQNGYRTPFLQEYCGDALALEALPQTVAV